ncbi:MAG: ATP-binding protein, partial [Nostoc sp.]
GIGKTAVVNEVHKPIVRQRGYFIKGKYDQFQRNIPFSAFVQAFRDLIGQLLTETDAQIQQWRNQILDAVGENGQVIIEVIPELEKIIGQQLAAAELSGMAAQNRFNLLFQKFIQVFTSAEHPLVMFLDDLQWADSASLKLMQLLMADTGYLLLIGAYRDNEVNPAHPLMLTLSDIQKTLFTINTITLAPLSQLQVNHLVADTLKCTESLAWNLSELVYQKTQGNPFFATQFLLALHQEHLIEFDFELGCWQCDIVQVTTLAVTDDVVAFMAFQLRKLPRST